MPSLPAIDIACAADAGYLPHAAAMLKSLFVNNPAERFAIHFLHRAGAIELAPLERVCREHGAELRARPVAAARVNEFAGSSRYPQEAWYRVILADLLPELSRVLWLDTDTIVLGGVGELWRCELGGRPLAAVPNALGPRHRDHLRRLGMSGDPADYFNTGVMVMDLARIRRCGLTERLRAECRGQAFNVFADQDVFGPVLAGDFVRLPLRWNVMAGAYLHAAAAVQFHGLQAYREALRAPRIVHFTQHKPWRFSSSHPYRERYLHFRREAGLPPPEYGARPLRTQLARRLPFLLRAWLTARDQVTLRDLAIRLRAAVGGAR